MQKATFIMIMNELDSFYGETWDHMKALGLCTDSDAFTHLADIVLEAIEKDVDPKRLAKEDAHCYDSESFLYEWLFGENDFNELCPTAESLWDYIMNKYAERNAQEYAKRAMGENLKED